MACKWYIKYDPQITKTCLFIICIIDIYISNLYLFGYLQLQFWNMNLSFMNMCHSRFYNNMLSGEFVLYKHQTLPYGVHVVFKRCGKGTCSCAAIIQSGVNHIKFDLCATPEQLTIVCNGDCSRNLSPDVKLYTEAGETYTLYKVDNSSFICCTRKQAWVFFICYCHDDKNWIATRTK